MMFSVCDGILFLIVIMIQKKSKIVQGNNINTQVLTIQQQYNVTKSIPEGENL